ncbi:hypothetical protein N7491_006437 [Penicillium cf. griseofulvum]|uniref:Uncharacterized protein n=1 Tax=Penicillium cf. griseofulvum TaxID=2972120 RepID=A0A9W9M370_9EURO|nr:hypothetical protein N7472_010532 [Penicillium cf. griseofulvum]KAJ5429421.1 hypothetical protein N7491_006437 [Penicillium cf. griseofulvum]KAJ5436796.1 hypothetical protein N7445_007681 [Penicillium cf. griseofulvum]
MAFNSGIFQPPIWTNEYERQWLSPEHIASIVGLESPSFRHSIIKTKNGITALVATIGPGVLFVYSMRRLNGSNDPYISELIKIAYETHFQLGSIKHIFMGEVQERETEPFIEEEVYPSREGLDYPSAETQIWDYDSHEFSAIMGTPVGQVVGYFILGAYGQGIRRISRIATFHTGLDLHKLHIRFDIDDA